MLNQTSLHSRLRTPSNPAQVRRYNADCNIFGLYCKEEDILTTKESPCYVHQIAA
jgi:hypothetical protein